MIAIGLAVASQLTTFSFRLSYGFGSEAASKTIRNDVNKKMGRLGAENFFFAMPFYTQNRIFAKTGSGQT